MRQSSLLLIGFLLLLGPIASGRESPAAFERSPREMLELAAAKPPPTGAAIEILSSETELLIGSERRESTTFHQVYRIIDANDAAESWKEVRVNWTHWMTERPELKARVITPDGKEHSLDSSLIQEFSASDEASKYSDARVLRAPLPAILDGAIVEVFTRQTSLPWARVGTVHRFPLQAWVPARHIAVRVQAPVGNPFRFQVANGTQLPQQQTDGTNRRVVVEAGPLEALKDDERGSPMEFPAIPALWVSTSASWQEVATEYSATVDRQLADSSLRELARQVVGAEGDAAKAANLILAWMKPLRYASVALGDSGMVPRTPSETLRRGFGDCKDLSTLIVGLLRASGFEAWTALLQTKGADSLEAMPGEGRFNHVIVRVGGTQPFWIDATTFASYPAGVLPSMDQGRMALVASPETRELIKLPLATPERNHQKVEVQVEFSPIGAGAILERHTAEGTFVDVFRPLGPSGLAEEREQREKWFREYYDAPGLSSFDIAPGELSQPVTQQFRGVQVRRVWTNVDTATFVPDGLRVFGVLPSSLTGRYDPAKSPHRTSPLEIEPQLIEVDYKLTPPRGFEPRPHGRSFEKALGPAVYSRKETVEGDGTVRVVFRLRLEGNRLTAQQVDEFRQALADLRSRPEEPITFDASVSVALERGQLLDAVDESRSLIRWEPSNPMHHVRLARALLDAGFGTSARAEAQQAVKLAPDVSEAWVAVADALSHDTFGRVFSPGWDRPGAILALRKALELKFDGPIAQRLAEVLEYSPDGEHFGKGSEPTQAVAVYAEYREREKKHDLDAAQAVAVVRGRLCETSLTLLRELDARIERNRLLLTCLALTSGASVAAEEATRLADAPSGQAESLEGAAQTLVEMREYSLARALLQVAERFAPELGNDKLRTMLVHTERSEDRKDSRPETAARNAISLALVGSFPGNTNASVTEAQFGMLVRVRNAFLPLYEELLKESSSKAVALDLLQGLVTFASEPLSNGGWRLRSSSFGSWPASEDWVLGPGSDPPLLSVQINRPEADHRLVAQSSVRAASDRAQAAGDLKRAQALRLKLVNSLLATPEDHLFVALYSLNLDDFGDVALDNAAAAVWMTKREDADSLATLGMVYLGRGELSRAHALALEAMALRPDSQPGLADWIVVMKVAIALGLSEEATAAQAHVDQLRKGNDAAKLTQREGPVRRVRGAISGGLSR